MDSFQIHYQWRAAGDYCFPKRFDADFRRSYCHAAVYRWRLVRITGEHKEPVYIGEAENLVRRIQRVLTPAKKARDSNTSFRLNKIFAGYVAEGRSVVLDFADIQDFELNGQRYGRDTLGDRFKRRALENVLLVDAAKDPQFELLNVVIDPIEKVREFLSTLPPNGLRDIAKKYSPDSLK
jgi:hypothetical protein